ncbi:hypothetical protein Tco_0261152 [Tanacetum coccineum]
MRRLTMEEMLAKFIDEGRREHEEMEIFIKEFRTTNELLLKTRSNLLSELKSENEPPRFEQDVQEKPYDDGEKNKSSSIRERTTQPLVKPQQRSIPFPNRKHKEAEDLAADHLSRFENPHMEVLTEKEIADKFSDKHLMALKSQVNKLRTMLAELRDGAYENTRIYKERTKKWHDSRLRGDKDFKVGDKVLLYNSRLKMYPGKLKSKWSGPNIVKTVYPHEAIEITDKDRLSFKVNGQRLKKYYGGNIDKEDDEVIELENDATRS